MKFSLARTLPIILTILALSSCEKDKEKPQALPEKTYTGREQIEVTYNGIELAGKSAHFKPGLNTSSLSLYSSYDLSQFGEIFKNFPAMDGPGVLPGQSLLSLQIPTPSPANDYSFSGKGETFDLKYSYEGRITAEKLEIHFNNVVLLNPRFAGTAWKPIEQKGALIDNTQPIHIVWETALPIPLPGLEKETQDILRMLVNIPFIPVYGNTADMSLTQVIENGLKSIAFKEDANMPVTYLQTANGASTFALAPECMLQFIPKSDSRILLFVNPTDVLSLILLNNTNRDPNIPENPWSISTRVNQNLGTLLSKLYLSVENLLSTGIPMNAVVSGDNMQLYFPTEVLMPLIKDILIPFLQDEEGKALIMGFVGNNEKLAPYSDGILALIDLFPLLIEHTTKIELGLNLTIY